MTYRKVGFKAYLHSSRRQCVSLHNAGSVVSLHNANLNMLCLNIAQHKHAFHAGVHCPAQTVLYVSVVHVVANARQTLNIIH